MKFFKDYDIWLIISLLIIQAIGLVGLYSSLYYESSAISYSLFIKQFIYILLGWFLIFLFSRMSFNKILEYAPILYFFNLFLLVLVLFIGKNIYGAKRWLGIGIFGIQPSEFMKISIILFVLYVIKSSSYLKLEKIIYILLIITIPFLLIYKEPDLGSAVIMVLPLFMFLFFTRFSKRVLLNFILFFTIFPFIMWHFMKPYQKSRILTVLSPKIYYKSGGYQLIQSVIAIGSGKIFGKGFLKGTQSHLLFLPERHTDFIFSVISEEFGFIVSSFLIFLYMFLVLRMVWISKNIVYYTEKLYAIAVASVIFFQSSINISMAMGLAPVVGIPLPFISYGGSDILVLSILIGLLFSVLRENRHISFTILPKDEFLKEYE